MASFCFCKSGRNQCARQPMRQTAMTMVTIATASSQIEPFTAMTQIPRPRKAAINNQTKQAKKKFMGADGSCRKTGTSTAFREK